MTSRTRILPDTADQDPEIHSLNLNPPRLALEAGCRPACSCTATRSPCWWRGMQTCCRGLGIEESGAHRRRRRALLLLSVSEKLCLTSLTELLINTHHLRWLRAWPRVVQELRAQASCCTSACQMHPRQLRAHASCARRRPPAALAPQRPSSRPPDGTGGQDRRPRGSAKGRL